MISDFDAIPKGTRSVIAHETQHATDFQKSLKLPVEIDSEHTEFETEIFRVWYGVANLGVFYQSAEGWIAEPFYGNPHRTRTLCDNPDLARDVIVVGYQVRGMF